MSKTLQRGIGSSGKTEWMLMSKPATSKRYVAVTGGYGFLGSAITAELEERGHFVLRARSKEYDLLNFADAEAFLLGRNADVLVHCAAFVGGIEKNVKHPAEMMYYNLRMGLNIIEQARRNDVRHLVLIGTACSYPKWPSHLPIHETDLWDGRPTAETGPYGIAKLTLFEMAKAYEEQYGMKVDLIIPSNLYGPGDNYGMETHVIPSLIRKFVAWEGPGPVKIWGTGGQTRDFLYVTDAARGIVDAVEGDGFGLPINLGSGVETTIGEVADILVRFTGDYFRKVPYKFEGKSTGYTGSERRVLDIRRAKEYLDWEPQVPLLEGLRATVNDYRKERNL